MTTPSITFTGNEVAFVVGALVNALPKAEADFEVLDLMLERAIAALSVPLDADVQEEIERLRDWGRRNAERRARGLSR